MVKFSLEIIKNNLYLIIPIIFVISWPLYYLIRTDSILTQEDFDVLYNCGKQILIDPANLYNPEFRFFYLPILAIIFAFTLSLLPLLIAHYTFFIITVILAIFSTLEYNKILSLMEIREKIHRFVFLMIISNGWIVYEVYSWGQFKYIILVIFLFIIRRELQYRKSGIEKNLNYYLINYGLFLFANAVFPPYILLFLIYLFHDIHFKEIFKWYNVKKYVLALSVFLFENFLFFIYPNYLFEVLNLYERHNFMERIRENFPIFYFKEWLILNDYTLIFLISTFYLIVITLMLIISNKLKIERKFAYFSFGSIIFSVYAQRTFLILLPLAILLFVPYLNQNAKLISFIQTNKILLLGLLSVVGLYFMPARFTISLYFPEFEEFPYIIIVNLRWLILLIILIFSYYFLFFKKRKSIKSDILRNKSI